MIDNLEALGIVNIFAAGNEGAAASSIRNPANRANDSLDCFAVGNVSTYVSPPLIASNSSRGPVRLQRRHQAECLCAGYRHLVIDCGRLVLV